MSVINDLVNPRLIGRGNMRDTCAFAGRRALSHLSHAIVDTCVILVVVLFVAPQHDRESNDNK